MGLGWVVVGAIDYLTTGQPPTSCNIYQPGNRGLQDARIKYMIL